MCRHINIWVNTTKTSSSFYFVTLWPDRVFEDIFSFWGPPSIARFELVFEVLFYRFLEYCWFLYRERRVVDSWDVFC